MRRAQTSVGVGSAVLVAILAGSAALAGCGGDEDAPVGLTEGAELAARLPSDDALNIAIVDVDAVRESIGMEPGSTPPTGSAEDDLAFLGETGPALGYLQAGEIPTAIQDAALEQARAIATVTGDRAATAIATSTDIVEFENLLRSAGLQEEDAAFVPDDDGYAVAIGGGVIAIADDAGSAASIIEKTGGELPEPLDQIDGDGELVTLARFGASCVDSIATSDSVGEEGEVAFFTNATPDPARIETSEPPPETPRIVGDSARVKIAAAANPSQGPPAVQALTNLAVSYDCDS